MKVAEEIRKKIQQKKLKQCDVAKGLGWTPQAFNNRLQADTFPAYDWIKIADYLGYDVVMRKKRQKHGKVKDKT